MGGTVVPVVVPVVVVTVVGTLIQGTDGRDLMQGTPSLVGLIGMGGDDVLYGGDAGEILFGDDFDTAFFLSDTPSNWPDFRVVGHDRLYGGAGNDDLFGGPGDDLLSGGAGDDSFIDWAPDVGQDTFRGGAGFDRISFVGDMVGLSDIDLHLDRLILNKAASIELLETERNIYGTNGANTFDLRGVTDYENQAVRPGQIASFGSFDLLGGADRFTGGRAAEYVSAGAGVDVLVGGGGHDTLNGGLGGADTLTGGAGRDVFEFGAATFGLSRDIGVSTRLSADTLTDFVSGQDKIALYLYAFAGLHPPVDGTIARAEFGLKGSADLTGREKVLYDPATGTLFKTEAGYVGNGATGAFAHVEPNTELTFRDFIWFTVPD